MKPHPPCHSLGHNNLNQHNAYIKQRVICTQPCPSKIYHKIEHSIDFRIQPQRRQMIAFDNPLNCLHLRNHAKEKRKYRRSYSRKILSQAPLINSFIILRKTIKAFYTINSLHSISFRSIVLFSNIYGQNVKKNHLLELS